jgi:hypothetical protein
MESLLLGKTTRGIWHAGLTSEGCCWRSGCHKCALSLCRDDWDVGWVGNHVSAAPWNTFLRPAKFIDFLGYVWLPKFYKILNGERKLRVPTCFNFQLVPPNPGSGCLMARLRWPWSIWLWWSFRALPCCCWAGPGTASTVQVATWIYFYRCVTWDSSHVESPTGSPYVTIEATTTEPFSAWALR